MRFLRPVPVILAALTALFAIAPSPATAAVVTAPGGPSTHNVVWDEAAILESTLEGQGLVFDILDVAGFAAGNSEIDCAGCELSVSGSEGAVAPEVAHATGPGGEGGWFGPQLASPAFLSAPPTRSHYEPSSTSVTGSTLAVAGLLPSLTTVDMPQPQSAEVPFCLTDCDPPAGASNDTIVDTTGGTDDGGGATGGASTGGVIPEPGSMILLGTGMLGLAVAVRRRLKR